MGNEQRSDRIRMYQQFVKSLPLPASSIETLYRHFDKLRDNEQQRVLADTLRRRGYTEKTFHVSTSNIDHSNTQIKDTMTRIVVVDSQAPNKKAGTNWDQTKRAEGGSQMTETIRPTHEMQRDKDHREFLSHHPFYERFHNMEFLRRFPGNGVMKPSKSAK